MPRPPLPIPDCESKTIRNTCSMRSGAAISLGAACLRRSHALARSSAGHRSLPLRQVAYRISRSQSLGPRICGKLMRLILTKTETSRWKLSTKESTSIFGRVIADAVRTTASPAPLVFGICSVNFMLVVLCVCVEKASEVTIQVIHCYTLNAHPFYFSRARARTENCLLRFVVCTVSPASAEQHDRSNNNN